MDHDENRGEKRKRNVTFSTADNDGADTVGSTATGAGGQQSMADVMKQYASGNFNIVQPDAPLAKGGAGQHRGRGGGRGGRGGRGGGGANGARLSSSSSTTSSAGAGGAAGRAGREAMDDLDDAQGETIVEEAEEDTGISDDEEDEGNVNEEAAGSGELKDRMGLKKQMKTSKDRTGAPTAGAPGDKGDDDDEEDGGKGKAKVKKIARVRGEEAAPDDEADEAGVTMMPFNLKDERDEGFFDETGNYVWKRKDPEEEADAWLEELDQMDPQERRQLQAGARKVHHDDDEEDSGAGAGAGSKKKKSGGGVEDEDSDDDDDNDKESEASAPPVVRARYLHIILGIINDGETVAAALRRLGAAGRKAGLGHSQKKAAAAAGASASTDAGAYAGAVQSRDHFNALTDAADGLVRDGMVDAYTLTRAQARFEMNDALDDANMTLDQLVASSPSAGTSAAGGAAADGDLDASSKRPRLDGEAAAAAGAPASDAAAAQQQQVYPYLPPGSQWQFVWQDPSEASNASQQSHGPFDSGQMNAWIGVGYFSQAQPWVRSIASASTARAGAAAAGAGAAKSAAADLEMDMFGDDAAADSGDGAGPGPTTPAADEHSSWTRLDELVKKVYAASQQQK